MELATGLNPTLRDGRKISAAVDAGGTSLTLVYPVRLPSFARHVLTPAWSPDLVAPFEAFTSPPQPGPDWLARAVLPLTGGAGFLRLESRTIQ